MKDTKVLKELRLMSEQDNLFINLLLRQIGWDNWPKIYSDSKTLKGKDE